MNSCKMNWFRLLLYANLSAILLLAPVRAQRALGGTNIDKGDCTCHPDPHITTFDGVRYDFQSGCDVVFVENAHLPLLSDKRLDIHLRLNKMNGWSAVDEVGIRIDDTVILIKSDGRHVILNPSTTTTSPITWQPHPADDTTIVAQGPGSTTSIPFIYTRYPSSESNPDAHTGGTYKFSLDSSGDSYIEVDTLGSGEGGTDNSNGISYATIRVSGDGTIFSGSKGLCGSWDNADPLTFRNGTPMPEYLPSRTYYWDSSGTNPDWPDLLNYGNEWQVNPTVDPEILQSPDAGIITVGTNWEQHPNACIPQPSRRFLFEQDSRKLATCTACGDLEANGADFVQIQRCNFDSNLLGCEFIKGAPFYDPTDPTYAAIYPVSTISTPTPWKSCVVHPDPHFTTWQGAHYDFHHGCDVVAVKNAWVVNGAGTHALEIHLRLAVIIPTSGSGGWSTVESFGLKMGNEFLLINDKGTYVNSVLSGGSIYGSPGWMFPSATAMSPSDPPIPIGLIAGSPLRFKMVASGSGSFNFGVYKLGLPGGAFIEVITKDPWASTGSGGKGDFMTIKIRGHGGIFAGSEGMCGNWNDAAGLNTGFYKRTGVPITLPTHPSGYYDGTDLGLEWQGPDTSATPADEFIFNPPHPSALWSSIFNISPFHAVLPTQCYPPPTRRRIAEARRLSVCTHCQNIENQGASQVQVDWCHFDGNLVGCSFVDNAPFYDRTDPFFNELYQCDTGSCGGDPHLKTFNGQFFSYHGECDMVLLQSNSFASGRGLVIHIRTTRVDKANVKYSYISGVALKIASNILEVLDDGTVKVDGATISDPVAFAGFPLTKSFKGTRKKIIVYSLEMGSGKSVQIRVNAQTGMLFADVKGRFQDSTGLLGPPKGDDRMLARDGKTDLKHEWNAFGEQWQVRNNEPKLFQENRAPQYPQGCVYESSKTSVNLLRRRLLLNENVGLTKEEASEACAGSEGRAKDFCIADVMVTGIADLAEDEFYH